MEGLVAAFMFVLGGSGFIILDQTHATNMPKLNRMMLQFIGFGSMIMAFSAWVTTATSILADVFSECLSHHLFSQKSASQPTASRIHTGGLAIGGLHVLMIDWLAY